MEKQRKKVDAIGTLKFTVGRQETIAFRKENSINKERGQSHFQKCIELGFHEQVSLWIHMVDVDESVASCITDITLVPRNHVSRNLIQQGYMLLASHELLPCALFGKRDSNNETVVSSIELSLDNKNDVQLANTHVVISNCLSKYTLAKGRLWILRLSRNEKAIVMGSSQSKEEFDDYKMLISSRPIEKALEEFIHKRTTGLLRSENLGRLESNMEYHILPYAIGFLGMNDSDIVSMEVTFRLIDRNSDGIISVPEFLKYINGPIFLQNFVHNMFTLPLESSYEVSGEQGWNFAATLNAVSVFAMFGDKEILLFILSLYGGQNGKLDKKELMDLTILLHPRRKDFMAKMVQEALPSDCQYLTLDEFAALNEECPQLLYPVFDLQVNEACFFVIDFCIHKQKNICTE